MRVTRASAALRAGDCRAVNPAFYPVTPAFSPRHSRFLPLVIPAKAGIQTPASAAGTPAPSLASTVDGGIMQE